MVRAIVVFGVFQVVILLLAASINIVAIEDIKNLRAQVRKLEDLNRLNSETQRKQLAEISFYKSRAENAETGLRLLQK